MNFIGLQAVRNLDASIVPELSNRLPNLYNDKSETRNTSPTSTRPDLKSKMDFSTTNKIESLNMDQDTPVEKTRSGCNSKSSKLRDINLM